MPSQSERESEVIRRLADGESPWTIDPDYGCTNPLSGYFPSDEVAEELKRRAGVLVPLVQCDEAAIARVMDVLDDGRVWPGDESPVTRDELRDLATRALAAAGKTP